MIRRRLRLYYEETFTTLSFYDPEIVYDVDATQSPLDVLRDIISRLSELQATRTMPRPSAVAEEVGTSTAKARGIQRGSSRFMVAPGICRRGRASSSKTGMGVRKFKPSCRSFPGGPSATLPAPGAVVTGG